MGSYIAGDVIELFTTDSNGAPGPFINVLTGAAVTPSEVVLCFRIEPGVGSPGATTVIKYGASPFNYDAHNTALVINFDSGTKIFSMFLDTTLLAVPSVLRSMWASSGTDQVISPSNADNLMAPDLTPVF